MEFRHFSSVRDPEMSRALLFLVAALAVVLAQFVDRRTAHLDGSQQTAGHRTVDPDDLIITGTPRKAPQR
jgi:hypothetical protein